VFSSGKAIPSIYPRRRQEKENSQFTVKDVSTKIMKQYLKIFFFLVRVIFNLHVLEKNSR